MSNQTTSSLDDYFNMTGLDLHLLTKSSSTDMPTLVATMATA